GGRLDQPGALVEDAAAVDVDETDALRHLGRRRVDDLARPAAGDERGHARSGEGAVAQGRRGQDLRGTVGEGLVRSRGRDDTGIRGPRPGWQLAPVPDDEELRTAGDPRE